MRKDTPVSPQLPEWKKEVAEKVKAYEERKKRLTTPPYPLKGSQEQDKGEELLPPPSDTPSVRSTEPVIQEAHRFTEKKQIAQDSENSPALHPDLEVWTDDLQGLDPNEHLQRKDTEEAVSGPPFLMRRFLSGIIDHTMLVVICIAILFGFAAIMGESMKWMIFSSWKATVALFLILHFIYYLYFFRASRQTPGMLFVSLELRDPVITVIPVGKLIVRWFAFILLNIFDLVPVLLGKKMLLLDQLSGTEMRSFN